MKEMLLRFVIGGSVVSGFALLGEVLRPKSFAGLFAAAPSIALATLGLAAAHQGKAFAAMEARSMLAGALGFFCYAVVVSRLLLRHLSGNGGSALGATIGAMPVWFAVSFGLWAMWLR
jgi:hypothetical protein